MSVVWQQFELEDLIRELEPMMKDYADLYGPPEDNNPLLSAPAMYNHFRDFLALVEQRIEDKRINSRRPSHSA